MTVRVHPFPSRTRKLSSLVPKILGGKPPGKIGRCRHKVAEGTPFGHKPFENAPLRFCRTDNAAVAGAKVLAFSFCTEILKLFSRILRHLFLNERQQQDLKKRAVIIQADLSYASLAQSVEHAAVNRRVVGSSPTGGAICQPKVDKARIL